jgi:hypothetical protein
MENKPIHDIARIILLAAVVLVGLPVVLPAMIFFGLKLHFKK